MLVGTGDGIELGGSFTSGGGLLGERSSVGLLSRGMLHPSLYDKREIGIVHVAVETLCPTVVLTKETIRRHAHVCT